MSIVFYVDNSGNILKKLNQQDVVSFAKENNIASNQSGGITSYQMTWKQFNDMIQKNLSYHVPPAYIQVEDSTDYRIIIEIYEPQKSLVISSSSGMVGILPDTIQAKDDTTVGIIFEPVNTQEIKTVEKFTPYCRELGLLEYFIFFLGIALIIFLIYKIYYTKSK